MADLLHYFAPVFSYGLALEEKLSLEEDRAISAEQARQELLEKVERAKAKALQDGKREQDVKEAAFAVVAWLDECIARYPDWANSMVPLQVALFGTANAGDEFFDHLDQLSAQQDEVREVYFMALGLGFVGRYYFDTGEKGELARLKETLGRQLPKAPASIHTLPEEHITPQPYLGRDPGSPRLPRHWDKLLLRTAVLLSILVPLSLVSYYILQSPPRPIPIPEPTSSVKPAIDKRLAGFSCAQLSATVSDGNRVLLEGHIPRLEDKARLIEEVQSIPGVTQVTSGVEVLIWPFCEVVEILSPYRQKNRNQNLNLQIAPHNHSTFFREGDDKLVLQLKAPTYDSYLYVDYYQRDGNVVHLLPNPLEPDNYLSNGETMILGQEKQGRRQWEISPPFGQEMITVIAVPAPLFDSQREEVEVAANYLSALRRRIESDRAVADYFFIVTAPGSE